MIENNLEIYFQGKADIWHGKLVTPGLGVSLRNAARNEARRKARQQASRPPVIELVTRPRTLIKILAGRM